MHAAARYKKLTTDRQFYLDEAEKSAELTIPSIMPEPQDALLLQRNGLILPKPYQSLGARGVNNLASKLLLTLFPPTGSFFRYEVNPKLFEEMTSEQADAIKTDVQERLASRERTIISEFDATGFRPKAFQVLRHLLVVGNMLTYAPPSGGMRIFPLNNYVCRRDFMGNVLELIYVELIDRASASPTIKEALQSKQAYVEPEEGKGSEGEYGNLDNPDKPLAVYTCVKREGETLRYWQEVEDAEVPGSSGTVAANKSPWNVLRFVTIDGEHYGRGFVEEYRGDLRSLEDLSKAVVFASLNAAKLVPIISPNAILTPRVLTSAENGQPVVGNHDDVMFLQQQKHADMQVAMSQISELKRSLSADFLLNSSFQRPGERVTAEEIRRMAEELEDTLGGVFSILSQDWQLPAVMRTEEQLVRRGDLAKLSRDLLKPTVVTGLAAIGRGQDLQRLREGLGMIAELAQIMPELAQRLNPADILKRVFIGVGVDTSGLLKSDQQIQAEQQAAQQAAQQQQGMELAAKLGPEAMKQAGPQIQEAIAAQGGLGGAAPQQVPQ